MAFDQINVVEQVETKMTFVERGKNFCKKHKKEIFTVVAIAGVAVGGVVFVKDKDKISEYLKGVDCTDVATEVVPAVSEFLPGTEIRREILERKTGNMLTPTKLGSLVGGISAQEVNKRIVAVGLQEKIPSGGFVRTEAGKLLGERMLKERSWGTVFSNIEWDEVVSEVISTPEECSKMTSK